MGSSRGNCEIIEAKDELSTTRKPQTFRQVRAKDQEQKPPILKKGHAKFMENDINKLFEAVNLRNSKSLDLSDSWRNASKRPMRSPGSLSPVIGFSEPVTLKQALRGLCISQAAEVAAMKRLSMTASPRISEAGKNMNLYSSTVVKVGGSPAQGGVRGMEVSPLVEASTSYSSGTLTGGHQDSLDNTIKPNVKNTQCMPSERVGISLLEEENIGTQKHALKHNAASHNESAVSSPHNPAALITDAIGSSSVCDDACSSEVNQQLLVHLEEEENNFGSSLPPPRRNSHDNALNPDDKLSGLNKVTTGVIKYPPSSLKVVNKAAPRSRRKSKLQAVPSSTAVNSNKDKKSARSTPRTGKPVLRSKNLIIKKSKKVAASTHGNLKTSNEVNGGLDHSSEKLICQRCKCSLRDTDQDSSGDLPATTDAGAFTRSGKVVANNSEKIPSGLENRVTHVTKTSTAMKSAEKGDISQSSSSIFGFSSSSTSLSDESVSGSACGNRPHMSKDMRWGAINRIRKQNGFLGLNHFNLLKKLGSGDIGTVYLAELIGTNCPFAIKVMDNEFLARRKKIPRAQTEGEILRMLDHPFLPTLYAQFTSDNLSCLVMEYCPGGDLHVLRQKQPGRYFPEQAARFYVAEVLLALEYLHMLGIVYRDLKPENILVREDGHIMLTDFDLSLRCLVNPTLVKSSIEPPRMSGPCAGSNCIDPFCSGPSCKVSCFTPRFFPRKVKSDNAAQARSLPQLVAEPTEARSNSFVGTHEYLAPEIIKGEGHGSAVDWWTFGVLLYELIYGKTPFKGGGNEETLANVVLQNLKFPDSPMVSFHARDLIRGLLVKEPENRLGTETGAAEIKRHPFFDGLNWALIRCAVPPEIPELHDAGSSGIVSQEKDKKFVKYTGNVEHLVEFELF